ncbi:hypothetical protein [Rhodoferax aquaticus]|uniref:DUF883 family protein n=1 Tax=Rhodoferax aquaticus TaxID=2527691 RepID=A0A515EUD0_9BURK|nr:hypothetical protein [Rhodoferax aquaticus]QDL56284.1 hypothetical protein EXZ61_20165 [Rhodoferax aquaticus]
MFNTKAIDQTLDPSIAQGGQLATQAVDSVTHSAQDALRATQHVANEAVHALSDATQQARHSAQHASDATVVYIKENPLKAVAIAAASGAALMVLARWLTHATR